MNFEFFNFFLKQKKSFPASDFQSFFLWKQNHGHWFLCLTPCFWVWGINWDHFQKPQIDLKPGVDKLQKRVILSPKPKNKKRVFLAPRYAKKGLFLGPPMPKRPERDSMLCLYVSSLGLSIWINIWHCCLTYSVHFDPSHSLFIIGNKLQDN